VLDLLDSGAFGEVYLASDEDLKRTVAIKVPRRQSFRSNQHVALLLNEAQIAAQFKHPGIVRVHDTGRQADGSIYIVFEYVDGKPLSKILKSGGLPRERMVDLLASVAEAIHYAHKRGLVHRDLKPDNILVDADGYPHVADFGLAVHEDGQRFHSGEVASTASYMAPEQVRGEAHRLDGRTDIWALGVILYKALAGRPPFAGERHQLFDEILHREPKPLRQIDETIPKELERICLKCLSKRMTDRYSSAFDLAQDLHAWLETARSPVSSTTQHHAETPLKAVHVGPKGPRAFDWSDADSFLNLLPGPRGRDGLPESVSFWKSRIEDPRGVMCFSVGLLYGPSGSGKSSLVKAGILPRLDKSLVHPVYVEASSGRTEAQLTTALRRAFPSLPAKSGLAETVAAITEGGSVPPGVKVLLVLDQFEQWLHAHPNDPDAELLRALRQCDGQRLQALLLVRDDFWMAITRVFKAIEVPLVEGGNSTPVEVFDATHARKVLVEFGIACERLPDESSAPGPEASKFLDQAIGEMTGSDGRVMPVRLSLFAANDITSARWSQRDRREVHRRGV
jgi:serine/threonine protein kinase